LLQALSGQRARLGRRLRHVATPGTELAVDGPRRRPGAACSSAGSGVALIRRSAGHRGSSANRAERAAHRRRPHEPDLVNPSEGRPRMSRKMYLTGSRPDIRVPMRAIALSGGNPPLRLYDTSGPYTDPEAAIDLKRGLPPLRR